VSAGHGDRSSDDSEEGHQDVAVVSYWEPALDNGDLSLSSSRRNTEAVIEHDNDERRRAAERVEGRRDGWMTGIGLAVRQFQFRFRTHH